MLRSLLQAANKNSGDDLGVARGVEVLALGFPSARSSSALNQVAVWPTAISPTKTLAVDRLRVCEDAWLGRK